MLHSLLIATALPLVMATTAPSTLPQVDFSRMGTVALTGSFTGLDFYKPSTVAFSTTGDTLVRGQTALGNTNDGGIIKAICELNGVVYVGGTFTTLAGVDAKNLAAYDPDTGFKALDTDSEVMALYCDGTNDEIWVGGDAVTIYHTGNSSFTTPTFTLDGVQTIVPAATGQNIFFGGDFSIRTTGNTTTSSNTTTVTNNTSTAYPSTAPDGTVSTSFSRYLTPLSLSNSTITAGPTTSTTGYTDITQILCPSGADGTGSSYWGRDDSAVKITVNAYTELQASGLRLGNVFQDGRGTTSFRVFTIPDNTQQTLTYTDPATGNNATCSSSCPLSTNSSISAQDFLFASSQSITGFQVLLEGWIGDGAGLHRLELLSSGTAANPVSSENYAVCGSASNSSSTTEQSGTWTTKEADTSIAGTVQNVLVASVSNGASERPAIIYYPYIAAEGNYSIYLDIPGCTDMQDCESRTSVDIEIFPYSGSLPFTDTVSQTNTDDASTLIYSGWMQATTTGEFQATVRLALTDSPATTSSGTWDVVAGTLDLVYDAAVYQNGSSLPLTTGWNETTTSTTSTNGTQAFGVWELVRNGGSTSGLSAIGQTLAGLSRSSDWAVNTIAEWSGTVYVAGEFSQTGNYSNVLAVANNQIQILPQQGLGGTVYTSLALGSYIYFGGDFTSSGTGTAGTLNHLARYDPSQKIWSSLGGGVDGSVLDLAEDSDDNLLVLGNFTSTLDSTGSITSTGGSALWNVKNQAWSTAGIVVGQVNVGENVNGDNYYAGEITGASANAASGIGYLSGSGDSVGLSTINLNLTTLTSSTPAATISTATKKRAVRQRRHKARKWMNSLTRALRTRQSTTAATTAPVIPSTPALAPSILAAVYWTNTSSSGNPVITCIGGNLTFSSTNSTSVGLYNERTGSTTPLGGSQPVGIVRALEIVDDTLFVAGNYTLGDQNSLASYSLTSATWSSSVPQLNSNSSAGDIYVVRQRPGEKQVLAAGDFTTAGSLPCVGICSWDLSAGRWGALGPGLRSGSVRAIDFAGESSGTLLVAGSFILQDSTLAYVAQYHFGNSSWSVMGTAGNGNGQLPGPALAIVSNDANLTDIFVSGVSTDGDSYFRRWDGTSWKAQTSAPATSSTISQLVFVPLSTTFSGSNGSIQSDRMLMATGSLNLADTGNATAALYDGNTWYPYLTSVGSAGAGSSGLFYSVHDFTYHTHHYLALGLIVLIALAIATGLIFLFVLLALLIVFLIKRHKKDAPPPPVITTLIENRPSADSDTDSLRLRRLGAIQEAVFGSAAIASTSFAVASKGQSRRTSSEERSSVGYDNTTDQGHLTAAQTEYGLSTSPSYLGRPTTVKYTFVAEDPAELSVQEGEVVHVLEEAEDEQWWFVRSKGREGVVPASYLW